MANMLSLNPADYDTLMTAYIIEIQKSKFTNI